MRKILLALLFMVVAAAEANACSCGPRTLDEEIKQSAAIFIGKVVRLEVTEVVDGISHVKVTIDVQRTFKGKPGRTVVMTTSDGCCYCAPWFEIARTYLIYAFEEDDDSLGTSTCSRTKLVAEAAEELKVLGK